MVAISITLLEPLSNPSSTNDDSKGLTLLSTSGLKEKSGIAHSRGSTFFLGYALIPRGLYFSGSMRLHSGYELASPVPSPSFIARVTIGTC
jgi:hypothetical protein